MKAEIEAKFLDVDFDEIRDRLIELGATCEEPMRLMRRETIDNDYMHTDKDSFLRVRDEGHRVTMTYKQFDADSVDGTQEIEVVVSDFESTVNILAQAGLHSRSFQESKRENWRLGEVEIMLDEWPWLKPYIEIEAESEAHIKDTAEKLGLDFQDAVFGDVMAAYRTEYPHLTLKHTIAHVPQVRFGDPLPRLLITADKR